MKYPIFSFDKFDYQFENDALNINFYYSCSEHKFKHKLAIKNLKLKIKNFDDYIFNIGMSLIPSYWKLFCSPTIKLPNFLTDQQLAFWHKLFIKGMGEYYYKNNIDFTVANFLTIENKSNNKINDKWQMTNGKSGTILVPVGGGKDSIVTLELLKPHYKVTAFAINPVSIITETIKTAGVLAIFAENIFDPQLFELNKQGFLNGHVPISAFYAFTALLVADLQDITYVVLSNEKSSNEGNTTYLGHEINHQYSKTLEFETDLNNYISTPKYFSFLRPLYELQITKIFSNYPQYFNVFSSCNNNFKINSTQNKLWCGNCPKCVSTALMLSQFLDRQTIVGIIGSFPNNQKILDELTGKSPVKPFECVLTRTEANVCITGQGLDKILCSWQDNPNMPEKFTKVLKSAL